MNNSNIPTNPTITNKKPKLLKIPKRLVMPKALPNALGNALPKAASNKPELVKRLLAIAVDALSESTTLNPSGQRMYPEHKLSVLGAPENLEALVVDPFYKDYKFPESHKMFADEYLKALQNLQEDSVSTLTETKSKALLDSITVLKKSPLFTFRGDNTTEVFPETCS